MTELAKPDESKEQGALSIYRQFRDPLEAVDRLGQWFLESGMFGCKNPAQGKVLALACLADGKSPIELARWYDVIDGKLSPKSATLLAWFVRAGGKFRIIERTSERAAVELTYNGQTFTFSMTAEDAKKEPYYYQKDGKTPKPNWSSPRLRMQQLWARVIGDGVRTLAPEVAAGLYTPEELAEDYSGIEFETPASELGQPNDPPSESQPVQEAAVQHVPAPPVESGNEPTADQLKEFGVLTAKLGLDPTIVKQGLQRNYGVEYPKDLTRDQIQNLIDLMQQKLQEKGSQAAE